jgi:hypothetical protein
MHVRDRKIPQRFSGHHEHTGEVLVSENDGTTRAVFNYVYYLCLPCLPVYLDLDLEDKCQKGEYRDDACRGRQGSMSALRGRD